MSIYLAWSIPKLLITLAVVSLLLYLFRKKLASKVMFVIPYILITLLSLNVGERQQNLKRSYFNNTGIKHVEKVEVDVLNSDKVNKQFNSVLKEKK